jgi:hypothetical protein
MRFEVPLHYGFTTPLCYYLTNDANFLYDYGRIIKHRNILI